MQNIFKRFDHSDFLQLISIHQLFSIDKMDDGVQYRNVYRSSHAPLRLAPTNSN